MSLQELCEKYGLPTIELDGFQPQHEAVKLLSLNLASKWGVLPLSKVGCVLTIVIADPLAIPTIDALRFHTGLRIEVVVAPADAITGAIARFYRVANDEKVVVYTSEVFEAKTNACVAVALRSPHIPKIGSQRLIHEPETYDLGCVDSSVSYDNAIAEAMREKEDR
jgi:hypothetical protein